MVLVINNKQISPCIVSKAMYALGITSKKPTNNKKCSIVYWSIVVHHLGNMYNVSPTIIQNANNRIDLIL